MLVSLPSPSSTPTPSPSLLALICPSPLPLLASILLPLAYPSFAPQRVELTSPSVLYSYSLRIGCITTPKDFCVAGTASEKLFGVAEGLWEPDLVRSPRSLPPPLFSPAFSVLSLACVVHSLTLSLFILCSVSQEPEDLFETISQTLLNALDRDALSGWGAVVHVMLVRLSSFLLPVIPLLSFLLPHPSSALRSLFPSSTSADLSRLPTSPAAPKPRSPRGTSSRGWTKRHKQTPFFRRVYS